MPSKSNPKAFDTLIARCKELQGKEAAVGWLGGKNYEEGTSVAYVAAINELGKNARPFIRPTIAAKSKEWIDLLKRGARAILLHGESAESVLEKVATAAEGDIADKITQISAPPLSPITILLRFWRRQGRKISGKTVGQAAEEVSRPDYQKPSVSEKPLVDRGIMLASLSHETRDST